MTIILDKEGEQYKITVKYPKKLNLDNLIVKFDYTEEGYNQMSFWLSKECPKFFEGQEVKTPEELFR